MSTRATREPHGIVGRSRFAVLSYDVWIGRPPSLFLVSGASAGPERKTADRWLVSLHPSERSARMFAARNSGWSSTLSAAAVLAGVVRLGVPLPAIAQSAADEITFTRDIAPI